MAVYLIRCHLRASAGARLAAREAPGSRPCPRKHGARNRTSREKEGEKKQPRTPRSKSTKERKKST